MLEPMVKSFVLLYRVVNGSSVVLLPRVVRLPKVVLRTVVDVCSAVVLLPDVCSETIVVWVVETDFEIVDVLGVEVPTSTGRSVSLLDVFLLFFLTLKSSAFEIRPGTKKQRISKKIPDSHLPTYHIRSVHFRNYVPNQAKFQHKYTWKI